MDYIFAKKICNCKVILSVFFVLLFLSSCQEGLDPTIPKGDSYVKGRVIVISGLDSWPKPDSALEMRVVGFREYPPKDILNDVIAGNAFISDTLPRFLDTIPFKLKIEKPPEEIRYLVVAIRYGTIFEWRVVGVFSDEMSYERKPKKILVSKGQIIEKIDILVDFKNLPKQPF